MILTRNKFIQSGIFGTLSFEHGDPIAFTLEHAFAVGDEPNGWEPKVAVGIYNCVRGQHQLEHMTHPFITFEITGVPNFMGNPVTRILFHFGNWNKDSNGCVLLGTQVGHMSDGGLMLMASDKAFEKFMDLLNGVDEFTLTVQNLN